MTGDELRGRGEPVAQGFGAVRPRVVVRELNEAALESGGLLSLSPKGAKSNCRD